jgi:aspartate/methionine/tyrosine aminotransferase
MVDGFTHRMVDLSILRARAYNHRWAVQAPDVIPLTAADLDFPVAPEIIQAIQRYVHSGYLCYGPEAGLPELREATARRQRNRYRPICVPEQVFATNSAASALYLVAQFVIEEPGQEAIIPDPVDFLLERSVLAAGGRVSAYACAGRATSLSILTSWTR